MGDRHPVRNRNFGAVEPIARPGWTSRAVIAAGDAYREALFRVVNLAGPRFGYAFSTPLALALYQTLAPLRTMTEDRVRRAGTWLGPGHDPVKLARESFLHHTWNRIDLMLAPGRLTPPGLRKYGGLLDATLLDRLQAARGRRQPALLVTAYFGPFDLLPAMLGAQGIPISVVYRPHANRSFDRLRQRIRGLAGGEMIPVGEALARVPRILDAGGMVGIVADQFDSARGIDTTFLGSPVRVPMTVGLFAARHRADVVVAGVRRVDRRFRFDIEVTDVINADEFANEDGAVREITLRSVAALERLIRRDPAQYNWMLPRWSRDSAQSRPT